MWSRIQGHVRSQAVGYVALFVALGGTAVAAGLPANSVGTKQIKNGAVTAPKVAAHTLTGQQINLAKLGTVPSAANALKLGSLAPGAFQRRVTGACTSNNAISTINSNGSVSCQPTGTGTVTSVGSGTGLSGGPITGSGTLSLASSYQLPQSCTGGELVAWNAGTPGWDCASSAPPSGTASGDLSGSYPSPTVSTINGHTPITNATSASGALSGTFPSPSLGVSGGPCATGEFVTDLSSSAALTCGPSGSVTALGQGALSSNTSPDGSSALGHGALAANTIGDSNSAVGQGALNRNTTGFENSAVGASALNRNTTGNYNTAVGVDALQFNTTGMANSALGYLAGDHLTTGGDNVDIANEGSSGDANTIKIGVEGTQSSTLIAGINGESISGPTNLALTNGSGLLGTGTTGPVSLPSGVDGSTSSSGIDLLINSSGVLGTMTSSRRFKTDIHPISSAQERQLMALSPVTFHYKRRYIHGQSDPLEYGLIAEQVARILPNLAAYGQDGKPYTVRYQELPALLLAQTQRQQRRIDSLESQDRHQQAEINWLMGQVRGHKG